MNTINVDLMESLERLAAAAPWEQVAIWTTREPGGSIHFTAIMQGDKNLGLQWACASEHTPSETVDRVIRENPMRSPEATVKQKITQLERELDALRGLRFELPPYKPTPYLGPAPEPEAAPPLPADHINIQAIIES